MRAWPGTEFLRIAAGTFSGLLPGLLDRLHRRTVLDALAEVGPAGMTPVSLELTTEITEPALQATLADLVDAGLICRRPVDELDVEPEPGMVSLADLHQRCYLLTEHAGRKF